jgi:hypothetical protein
MALAFIVAVIFIFAACSSSIFLPGIRQNTDHIVRGNGTSAVQYGNYVYYINGYRGFDDVDGNQNKDVVKGAVYRTELFSNGKIGGDFDSLTHMQFYGDPTDSVNYNPDISSESYIRRNEELRDMRFFNHESTEWDDGVYDDEKTIVVDTNRLADKTVGTSGYKDGGMFIFDEHLFFATPSNERDYKGNLLSNRTQFFKVNLFTGVRTKVYSTNNDSFDSPYAFYKFNNAVYLVVKDGTDIVSVKAAGAGKSTKPVVVASSVEEVIMPHASVYYKDMPQDYVENFVYFTRAHEQNFMTKGNVLEMTSPDGSQRLVLSDAAGRNIKLHSVRDGMLFFVEPRNDGSAVNLLRYDNLYEARRQLAIERGVTDTEFESNNVYWDENGVIVGYDYQNVYINERAQVDGIALQYSDSEYTSIYPFRRNRNSNFPEFLANTENETRYISNPKDKQIVINTSAIDIQFIKDGFVYYIDSNSNVARTYVDREHSNNSQKVDILTSQAVQTSGLRVAIVADYLVYFSKLDEFADNYAFFQYILFDSNAKEFFVGQRSSDDIKPEEDADNGNSGDNGGENGGEDNSGGDGQTRHNF